MVMQEDDFVNGLHHSVNSDPQRLKPRSFCGMDGTPEGVPFQRYIANRFLPHLVKRRTLIRPTAIHFKGTF